MMKEFSSTSYLKLSRFLFKVLPGLVECVLTGKDDLHLTVKKEYLFIVLTLLKVHQGLRFSHLLDIFGVDYLNKENRFEINYVLVSLKFNFRLIIKTILCDYEGISSVEPIFSSAGWLEREVWDLFGVYFFGNFDLRRILTDYGFEGYPLRKDFPLSGFMEVRYDDFFKVVLQEPLEITQAYRVFNFTSPWE